MECQIGEIRKVGNKWLQCIESACNKECYFYNRSLHKTIAGINGNDFGACNACLRSDDKSVIFKELEKIGEPYDDCGTILQRFKIYTNVTNADTKGLELHIYSNDTIGIEIKQDKKEDMGEKKVRLKKEDIDFLYNKFIEIIEDCVVKGYNIDNVQHEFGKLFLIEDSDTKLNLKPFDLEAAKLGKSICTRDGRKARIVCFDKNNLLPIVALVAGKDGLETIFQYYPNGQAHEYVEHPEDLMILTEKKEGWINIYENRCYNTKEEAVENRDPYCYCMTTVKVSWKE